MQNINTYKRFYIDGKWVMPSGSEICEVINPATEAVAGVVPVGDVADVDHAVKAARAAFASWSNTSAQERSDYIVALVNEMKNRADELGELVTAEMGMPVQFSKDIQVLGPVMGLETYIETPFQLEQPQTIGNSVVYKEAIGVCSLICPWNYPLHQLIGKIAPALAAGCTMVVKPACETPLSTFLMAQIIDSIGLPKGVFNLVSGPGTVVGEAMCVHPEVDLVSFTGSTGAGVSISQTAAKTVKRVCLELGGKSPLLITQNADLASAVTFGVNDVMINSGQTCTALTRMLVPASRYEEAVAIAKGVAESLIMGDPLNKDSFMGPMSSHRQKQAVINCIKQGIAQGATLVTGGVEVPSDLQTGYYISPTIFANVSNDMSIAQDEIFGPVLCMIPYDDEQQGIEIANDTVFGLAAHVWAGTQEQGLAIAKQIRAGQVFVNGADYNYDAPFGGYKQSGNGREWGYEGALEYVELKSIQL